MNFTIGEIKDVSVIRVFENITYVNQKEFLNLVNSILSSDCKGAVLDLSQMKFLGSLGIGAIAKLYGDLKDKGGRLVIVKPPAVVFKVFSLTGLADIITFFDTEKEALDDFGVSPDDKHIVAQVIDDDVESKLKRLKDDNPEVRRYVAWSLGLLRDPRAISPLEASLEDPALEVREAAADALTKLTGKRYYWKEPD